MANAKPLSGANGLMIWSCGCETRLQKGEPLPAGCEKHDKDRVRENRAWTLEMACKLYTDDFGRVIVSDRNGDGRVVFDPNDDNDFDRMMEVIEEGLLAELARRELEQGL